MHCHTARSAKEAIDRLLELQGTPQQINVVVSDIEMSEMDGYAFTRTVNPCDLDAHGSVSPGR